MKCSPVRSSDSVVTLWEISDKREARCPSPLQYMYMHMNVWGFYKEMGQQATNAWRPDGVTKVLHNLTPTTTMAVHKFREADL